MAAELIRTPDVIKSLRRAIKRGLQQGAKIVERYAVLNVSGRILKRKSGELARSIYTKVTSTRSGGTLRVGTKLHYGVFWEFGFRTRGTGKVMMPRPWLRPAAEQATSQIAELIDLEVNRELNATLGKITIELKLS